MLSVYTMAASCTLRALANDDLWNDVLGWWPAMCGVKAGGEVSCLQLPCCALLFCLMFNVASAP